MQKKFDQTDETVMFSGQPVALPPEQKRTGEMVQFV